MEREGEVLVVYKKALRIEADIGVNDYLQRHFILVVGQHHNAICVVDKRVIIIQRNLQRVPSVSESFLILSLANSVYLLWQSGSSLIKSTRGSPARPSGTAI
jgi:hypothetical protein